MSTQQVEKIKGILNDLEAERFARFFEILLTLDKRRQQCNDLRTDKESGPVYNPGN